MSKIIVVLFLITSSGLEYKKMTIKTDGTCFDAIEIAKNKISKHYWHLDNPKRQGFYTKDDKLVLGGTCVE